MKKLELNQMENLEGGGKGFGTGLSCGILVIGMAAALTAPTFGVGTYAAVMIGGMVCGGSIGWASAGGDWF